MEIWIAESPYKRLGFYSKEKAKTQVKTWLMKEYEHFVDICDSTATLNEAVECVEKVEGFDMYGFNDERYEWFYYKLEMGE